MSLKVTTQTNDPARKDREFRRVAHFELRTIQSEEGGNKELWVEGYAATFNDPTVLWEFDGVQYKEQIAPEAFNGADMSDVVFNYNHGGKVLARTRNKTLELKVDTKGLFMRARIDGTEEGRRMYEEIDGGYVDRMSFAFSVTESKYDRDEHLRTVTKVKKVYDVAAVDFPAYDNTTISARSFFEAQIEAEEKTRQEARKRRMLLLTQV